MGFCVSLDYSGFVLLVLLGFGFFSVLSQEIGWEERLRNDLAPYHDLQSVGGDASHGSLP